MKPITVLAALMLLVLSIETANAWCFPFQCRGHHRHYYRPAYLRRPHMRHVVVVTKTEKVVVVKPKPELPPIPPLSQVHRKCSCPAPAQ